MPKEALTITVDATRRAELDRPAAQQGRHRDAVIADAIANWLDLQAWQTREIEAGLADADAGSFASDEELAVAYGAR